MIHYCHPDRPQIVVLCGSTRFRDEINQANADLTRSGYIVLAPGVFGHNGDPLTDDDKIRLDELHMRKIDLADQVCVIAPGGYIGESTRREIKYANGRAKLLWFWEDRPGTEVQ